VKRKQISCNAARSKIRKHRDTAAKQQDNRCAICGKLMLPPSNDNLSVSADHIIPFCLGGTHDASNIRAVHRICNIEISNTHEKRMMQMMQMHYTKLKMPDEQMLLKG
jgi:hypothetical protein